MLKATLFTAMCGLLSARLPLGLALLGLTLLSALEMGYLAVNHPHSLSYLTVGFFGLFGVGEIGFYVATMLFLGANVTSYAR